MFKKIVLLTLLTTACSTPETESDKLDVKASFYPLAYFAEEVGGDKAEVENLVPAGVEPHDFEPGSKSVADIHASDIFLFNGAGLDPWAEALKVDLEKENVYVLEAVEAVDLLEASEEEHREEENEEHEEGEFDPHFWLDPNTSIKVVEEIMNAYAAVQPENTEYFKMKGDEMIAKLKILDSKFGAELATCDTRDFVTSHAAFAYLAKAYNLNMIAISGISPEEEPSSKQLAEISDLVKEHGIKYIFSETLLNQKFAETIANESGAEILILNPIEGLSEEDIASGKNYISVMEENLQNLKTAMSCH